MNPNATKLAERQLKKTLSFLTAGYSSLFGVCRTGLLDGGG